MISQGERYDWFLHGTRHRGRVWATSDADAWRRVVSEVCTTMAVGCPDGAYSLEVISASGKSSALVDIRTGIVVAVSDLADTSRPQNPFGR